jgi:hypothetical protein
MNNTQLGYYLAGLIEGDDSIWTPKALVSLNEYIYVIHEYKLLFIKKETLFFENFMLIIGAGGIFPSKHSNSCKYLNYLSYLKGLNYLGKRLTDE